MNEIEQGCDESVNEHFRGGLEMEFGRERCVDKWDTVLVDGITPCRCLGQRENTLFSAREERRDVLRICHLQHS